MIKYIKFSQICNKRIVLYAILFKIVFKIRLYQGVDNYLLKNLKVYKNVNIKLRIIQFLFEIFFGTFRKQVYYFI